MAVIPPVRVSDQDKALVERAATLDDRSVSEFCRRAILEAARKKIRETVQN